MNNKISLVMFVTLLTIAACAPQSVSTPLPDLVHTQTLPATGAAPTENTYSNTAFGLSFRYPLNWFGPDEYISDNTLRVAVGSDVVQPYGSSPVASEVTNSYLVVVQYSKNDQNQYWRDIHLSLVNMLDGASVSDSRGLTIRVRAVEAGRFTGFEYISTLSETAQTEPVYIREVILTDDQSNLLRISGMPNNVVVPEGMNWRDVYRLIDEGNLGTFRQIVESLTIQ